MTERTRVVRYISGDFFTGPYRMTGRMSVGAAGAVGVLNDATRSAVICDDVYISYVISPGSILAHYTNARVTKSGLEVLLITKREDIGPVGFARTSYQRLVSYPVLVTTDAFEVRGNVELPGKYEPEILLFEGGARFFPVYNATINAHVKPDARFTGEAVLINRARVSAFCGGE